MLLFKVALDQVMFMNVTTVWTLSNRLGSLALNKVPGEDVSELTLEMMSTQQLATTGAYRRA